MGRTVGWAAVAALCAACSAGNSGGSYGGGSGGGTSGGGLMGSGGPGVDSAVEEHCKAIVGCTGGNDKDIAACVAGQSYEGGAAKAAGCVDESAALDDCARAKGTCDGSKWSTAACAQEAAADKACMKAASCAGDKTCQPKGPAPSGDFGEYCFESTKCIGGNDVDVAECVDMWSLIAVVGSAYGCTAEVDAWKACLAKVANPCGLDCTGGLGAITDCEKAESGKKQ